MATGYRGTYAIAWDQVSVDGGHEVRAVARGAVFQWTGEAVRMDGPPSVMLLGAALGRGEMRARAGKVARRLACAAGAPAQVFHQDAEEDETEALPENSFMVTDGIGRYTVIVIPGGCTSGPLLVFEDGTPPADTPLRVIRTQGEEAPIIRHGAPGGHLICFTVGTMIRTPGGACPVELLRPGELVATKDNGAQELLWIGSRHITGARMFAMPGLRPVRIRAGAMGGGRPDADLRVSPEHRMLYRGAKAQALFNTPEVLVPARALIDDHSVTVDYALTETTYFHLLLARQEILWANGAETESFHPGAGAGAMLEASQRRELLALCPELGADAAAYGDYARRVLSPPEAEIMLHGGPAGH